MFFVHRKKWGRYAVPFVQKQKLKPAETWDWVGPLQTLLLPKRNNMMTLHERKVGSLHPYITPSS